MSVLHRMRNSQSLGNLQVLPDETSLVASLLRLTVPDKMEISRKNALQRYIKKYSQFPYHKLVREDSKVICKLSVLRVLTPKKLSLRQPLRVILC